MLRHSVHSCAASRWPLARASGLSPDGVHAALRVLSEIPPTERDRGLEVLPIDPCGEVRGEVLHRNGLISAALDRTTGINKKEPKALD